MWHIVEVFILVILYNNINKNIYLAGIWLVREYGDGDDDRII